LARVSLAGRIVLAAGPAGEDRAALCEILTQSQCVVRAAGTVAEARAALRDSAIRAVIVESRFPDGQCWKDLLAAMQNLRYPPPLIVVDRLADESLWAEVLNLGADDLLAKPFDPEEVLHAVGMACCHAAPPYSNPAPAPMPCNEAPAAKALAAVGALA
jgi:DNA-binding response OmpR family regulator